MQNVLFDFSLFLYWNLWEKDNFKIKISRQIELPTYVHAHACGLIGGVGDSIPTSFSDRFYDLTFLIVFECGQVC